MSNRAAACRAPGGRAGGCHCRVPQRVGLFRQSRRAAVPCLSVALACNIGRALLVWPAHDSPPPRGGLQWSGAFACNIVRLFLVRPARGSPPRHVRLQCHVCQLCSLATSAAYSLFGRRAVPRHGAAGCNAMWVSCVCLQHRPPMPCSAATWFPATARWFAMPCLPAVFACNIGCLFLVRPAHDFPPRRGGLQCHVCQLCLLATSSSLILARHVIIPARARCASLAALVLVGRVAPRRSHSLLHAYIHRHTHPSPADTDR